MEKLQSFVICIVIFILSVIVCDVDCQKAARGRSLNIRVHEKQLKDKLLSEKYDKWIRPGPGLNGSGATEVKMDLLLRSVSSIDDFKMEYSVQLTMREEWIDPRLKFNDTENLRFLTISDVSRIWMPDVFFINEKDGRLHNLIKPNAYIRVYPDGRVMFSIRISLTLACPMYLALFPMDTQICSISMASYSWTSEDLVFTWKDTDPVQLGDLSLPRFHLQDITTTSANRVTSSGNYSSLHADLHLVRNFSYYLVQMYLPCIMLVIVSWIAFFLDENAVPARTGLGVTTLLTMATLSGSMKSQSAAVSYTKALDVWSSACLAFVFAALLEFAVVDYCRRYDKRKGVQNLRRGGCYSRCNRRSKRVDITARIAFPLLFASFNVVYWTYYLLAEDDRELYN